MNSGEGLPGLVMCVPRPSFEASLSHASSVLHFIVILAELEVIKFFSVSLFRIVICWPDFGCSGGGKQVAKKSH